MSVLLECAKLSKAIYEFEAVEGWTLTDWINGEVLKGDIKINTGFRAGLYVHQGTQTHVVAIAGADFLEMGKDYSNENRMSKQFKSTELFYKYIKEKYVSYRMIATGHSLGGACAAYIACLDQDIEAYIINAPDVDELEGTIFVTERAKKRIHRYYIQKNMITETAPTKIDDEEPIATEIVGGIFQGILQSIFRL